MLADLIENDMQWKLMRTKSLILEEFQERYVTRKPAPVQTEIGGMIWLPYGDFKMEDPERERYVNLLIRQAHDIVRGDNGAALSDQVSHHFMKEEPSPSVWSFLRLLHLLAVFKQLNFFQARC